MFYHLKEATIFTWNTISAFFIMFWFVLLAFSDWLKGFAAVNYLLFELVIPKALVILIGLLITPYPLLLLIPMSFIPLGFLGGIYFVTFIVMFIQ